MDTSNATATCCLLAVPGLSVKSWRVPHQWNVRFVCPWRLQGNRAVSVAGSPLPAREDRVLQWQSILCCVCSWAQFSFPWHCSNADLAFGSEGGRNMQAEGHVWDPCPSLGCSARAAACQLYRAGSCAALGMETLLQSWRVDCTVITVSCVF